MVELEEETVGEWVLTRVGIEAEFRAKGEVFRAEKDKQLRFIRGELTIVQTFENMRHGYIRVVNTLILAFAVPCAN